MTDVKKPATKKIVDVAHPGESAPSKTSKPVIITNRTILKDPMVVDEDKSTTDNKEVKTTAPTLAPADAKAADATPEEPKTEEPKAEKPEVEEPKVEDLVPETKSEEPAEKPAPEAKAEPEPEPEPETKPAEEADAPAAEETPAAETEEKTEDKTDAGVDAPDQIEAQALADAKAAEEHDTEIQKMVDSKQFYLPINSVEKRKTRRFVVLGAVLAVLLALAWADIALDAGLIHINNVQPVTHFFSN